ncbi:class I SAM-dependent methyltransferase [Bizionia sediminis]|uniref:Class I SAM-dependent methyltransferase n=1 Tax=Bizionia sediminis TaxID=1737064 RepID=A0ABW5KQT1_9FLAO
MNQAILHPENQTFIQEYLDKDTSQLIFKKAPNSNVSMAELVAQIEAKKRCKTKLPTWYQTPLIYYPTKLQIEQTSSELTANYKAQLVSGAKLLDATGGFGVDSYYFSKQVKQVVHCEINSQLSELVNYNLKQLQITNIETVAANGLLYLQNQNTHFNWIYLDPSRRNDSKGKVFFLSDCLPNVPEALPILFNYSPNLLIKTAPLLDISAGIKELEHVKEIHVVAVNNDVKELLWVLEKNTNKPVSIITTNLTKTATQRFRFWLKDEANTQAAYSVPRHYLYEPNAAILKSGAFNTIAQAFNCYKLEQHTHLYTHQKLLEFPGRTFSITATHPYTKKNIKALGIKKANISTRNFPESVADIRKKFKIADGGTSYLFFTTNMHQERIVIECKKVTEN